LPNQTWLRINKQIDDPAANYYTSEMIEEQAIVTGLDGNWAMVKMQRQSACSSCELSSGCGTGAIGRLLGHRSKPVMIKNEHQLKQGDSVVLGLPEDALLKASLLIYGLPLLGLIAGGILAGLSIGESELAVFVFAATGFVTGLQVSARLASKRYSNQFSPKILRIRDEPTN
jgi:sigma-E factor negative regulatory protein RseC